ncbi:uncharacterized protein F5891DRAFT_1024977 [Suillus fuscotomentosus]|uniref:Uncharacterized protein n=1 Tax=Suillus fuscotomentosus TaxID=1912939 RepID=A0AAD4E9P2_9AGAM|nr:uncharacterized protein F5891DRAFT_1024977 [Suillus fuscotomentosus]KAG1902152.1 hypothetical protein F5891DRAFT_1024977 [Suillus fuscotomentosus]
MSQYIQAGCNDVAAPSSIHSPAGTLRPTTSVATARYGKSPSIYSYHTVIPPGSLSVPSTLDTQTKWNSYPHPEGQLYFQARLANYVVVTEANVYRQETESQVSGCLKFIDDIISQQQIIIPPSSELFIELDEFPLSCAYYFVDHDTRRIFWIEQTSTELLDMGTIVSDSHRDIALERLYWVHVEFFPMHIYTQLSPQMVDDLIGVMSHGAADRMTSRSSTFPYTAERCSQLLQLLSLQRGRALDGHTLCFVARLWGAIENQRFLTYYGQEHAQLDRLQIMTPEEDMDHQWVKTIANLALWGIPDRFFFELHDLFANEQVFVDQWQIFMTTCVSEWHTAVIWTFPITIATILSCLLSRASLSSALPAILSASGSLAVGSILLLKHHGLEDATASFAARYLRAAKSRSIGMLPSAIVFSLPKGLYLWSIVFMVAHFLLLASHVVGGLAMFGGACFLILLVWAALYVTSPDEYDQSSILSKILCRWHSIQGDPEGAGSLA